MSFDNTELKQAIYSLTGVKVSDEFITILKKHIDTNGDDEIDLYQFQEAFSNITRSLYPDWGQNQDSRTSNPPSPPPSPTRAQRSRSHSSSSVDLPTPTNSPRNSEGSSSSSPFGSPMSTSPPKYSSSPSTIYAAMNGGGSAGSSAAGSFNKPPPISPRRLGSRGRSNSLNKPGKPSNLSLLNDDQTSILNGIGSSSGNLYELIPSPSQAHPTPLMYKETKNRPPKKEKAHKEISGNSSSHDLFKSLLSLDGTFSDSKKRAPSPEVYTASSNEVSETEQFQFSGDDFYSGGEDNGQFRFEIDWAKQLEANFEKDKEKKKKKKVRRKKKVYTYKDNGDYSSDESDEEIEFATQEFYYDPELTNIDDLHQIIMILKEKYTESNKKAIDFEKKMKQAIKLNNQLEDDIDSLKKDCITLSLSNQALKKNNKSLENTLDSTNINVSQMKQGVVTLEKENNHLKKKVLSVEEELDKHARLLDTTREELETSKDKYSHELTALNQQYTTTIQSVKSQYQQEFELVSKKSRDMLKSLEAKKNQIEAENQKLSNLLYITNKKMEHLQQEYDEKIREFEIHEKEKESQTISHEILTTKNQKLKQLILTQYLKFESKKIEDIKKEIKRTVEDHTLYKSLFQQGIDDMKSINSIISKTAATPSTPTKQQPTNNDHQQQKSPIKLKTKTRQSTTTTTTDVNKTSSRAKEKDKE